MKTRRGYLIRRGKTFYAVWNVGNKRVMKTTRTHDKREATAELARIMRPYLVEDELATLESVKSRIEGAKGELAALDAERNPPLTLAGAWSAYAASQDRPDSGPGTLRNYEANLCKFRKWLSEHYPTTSTLREVTGDMANEYAQHLAAGASASTFNQHIGFLRLLWRVVAEKARTTGNPWDRIKRKKVVSVSRRELTVEELREVCRSTEGEMRPLFALGLYTGLRLGDCATLRWGDVDMKRHIIRRIPNKIARRNPAPVVIPIHAVLHTMLSEITERREYVLPDTAATYQKDPTRLTEKIQAHFAACGARTHKPGTGEGTSKRAVVEVGFHSLRHTFVSLCRESHAPLSVVEAIVGHSNPAMTRHYTHVSELAAASAVNALPSVVENTPALLPPAKLIDAATVRALAERLTRENAKEIRTELLQLV